MKLACHPGVLVVLAVASFVGCGVPGIPKPPSLNLPQPVSDLRAVRKGDRVYLAWTVPTETTDSLPVRHLGVTRVCRNVDTATASCADAVGEVPPAPPSSEQKQPVPRTQANYTDAFPRALLSGDPTAKLSYVVSVSNENGRSAGLSNTVQVPAVVAPLPPVDFHVQVTAEGVVLGWKDGAPAAAALGMRRFYRVFRRQESANASSVAGEMPLDAFQLVDPGFEWEKTYSYLVTVVTVIEGNPGGQFEGEDTPAVKVFVHDVFPPAVPSGLQAVFSGAGQEPFVDLIWAPDTEGDLAGYNLYRREGAGEPSKINSGLVKTLAFRDTGVSSGHTYLYSVSAVDIRGNESERSAEASESEP